MSKQLAKVITRIGLLSVMALVMAVGSTQAQSLATRIRVNIPFDFTVGDKNLPAGEYSVGRALSSSGDTVLAISNVDQHANSFPLTSAVQSLEPKDKGMLVFHRYGEQYFLFQVWPAGAVTGRVLPKSRSEREVERKLSNSTVARAGMKQACETVTIVAGLQ